MRVDRQRRPGAVPDDGVDPGSGGLDPVATDVHGGTDTDGDGQADTLLTADGADLLVLTDLDGDMLADRMLDIGPDGAVHAASTGGVHHVSSGLGHGDGPVDGPVDGHARAQAPWSALLRLFGLDP